MKVLALSIAALLALLWLGGNSAQAQDEKGQDFQKVVEKYGTPGPEHENLEPLVGTWKVSVKFYLKPGAEPMASEGISVRKWKLGKRIVTESYKGTAAGQEFQGMGWSGYDRYTKKYVTVWTDTMSTAIALAKGTYDSKKKTFTYVSVTDDPLAGGKVKIRDVVHIVSNDEHTMESFRSTPTGENEFMVLELRYVRTEGKKKKEQ
jgi:hypothetical protein